MIIIHKFETMVQKIRISFGVRALVLILESWYLGERLRVEVSVCGESISWSDPQERS